MKSYHTNLMIRIIALKTNESFYHFYIFLGSLKEYNQIELIKDFCLLYLVWGN